MSYEIQFRLAIAYVLLLRLGLAVHFRHRAATTGAIGTLKLSGGSDANTSTNLRRMLAEKLSSSALLAWRAVDVLYVAPLMAYLAAPEMFRGVSAELSDGFRWAAMVPAVAGLLLYCKASVASKHCLTSDKAKQESWTWIANTAPYSVLRHPIDFADALTAGSLTLLMDAPAIALIAMTGYLMFARIVAPELDRTLQSLMGPAWEAYRDATSWNLRGLSVGTKAQYTVPKRFSIGSVFVLTTLTAVGFGLLNQVKSQLPIPPSAYLFLSMQVLAVCLAQMICGGSPRGVSMVIGAILLPIFGSFWLMDFYSTIPRDLFLYATACLTALGVFVGYVVGALAAGYFLVADLVAIKWQRPTADKPDSQQSQSDDESRES